jgi:hypothetical protein
MLAENLIRIPLILIFFHSAFVKDEDLKRRQEKTRASFIYTHSTLQQKLIKMKLSTGKLQFWEWKKHPVGPGTFCPGILHSSIAGMSSGLRSGTFSADIERFLKSLNIKKNIKKTAGFVAVP